MNSVSEIFQNVSSKREKGESEKGEGATGED